MDDAPKGREAAVDRERLVERLVELVRIPSPGGHEEAAIGRVGKWLLDLGADVELWHDDPAELQRLPGYPGHEIARATLPVLAARLRGRRPGPAVLLTGHVDVVPVGDPSTWTRDPYSGVVEDGRVYGRGACDMKAGVVSILEVMEVFARDRDFPGQIILVAVPAEEDGGSGTFSAIQRGWRGDVALMPEPTSVGGRPQLVVSQAGCMILQLTVFGRSAHASTRLSGESALDHYLRLHEAMRADERAINAAEDDPLMRRHALPYATNVGRVSGGVFASSVMESLTVDVRVGVPLHETTDETEARLRRVVAEAAAADPWLREHPPEVKVITRGFGAARVSPGHRVVEVVADAAERVFGERPEPRAVPYASDMAGWVELAGVPTVMYGAGDLAQAHGADEHVSIDEVADATRVLVRATQDLLASPSSDGAGGHRVIPSTTPAAARARSEGSER
jgi:acetylornithine deacetylase